MRERTPAPPPTKVSGSARVFTDTEDHGFVQQRLAYAYGLFTKVLAGFFVLSVVATAVLIPQRFWELNSSPARVMHLLGIGVLAFATWLCRGPTRPRWMLAVVDLFGIFEVMALTALIVGLAPQGVRAEMFPCVIYVFVVSLRAALVPSPPKWTLLVCALAAIPVPIGSYIAALHDPHWPADVFPRSGAVAMVVGWGAAGTAGAWAISRVVYGLRGR